MAPRDPSGDRGGNRSAGATHPVAAVFAGALAFVVAFFVVHVLAGLWIGARFPNPQQAAVWTMIAGFVSATAGVAAGAQVWWLVRGK